MNNLATKYAALLETQPQKWSQDLAEIERKLAASTARYQGKPINFLYHPIFFDEADLQKFRYISQMMSQIIQKTVQQYLALPSFREHFGFSAEMEELILIDPGYSCSAPIARFDIFYDGDFKFCELNGDGTSAMNEANTLEQIFMQAEIIKQIGADYDISYHELFKSWLTELLNIYREWGGTKTRPNIAIVDFLGLGSTEEFEVFQQVFEKAGHTTVICDPRELLYKDNKLYFQDLQIDLVYRRAVNQEVEKRLAEVEDFIQAYREQAVCVVGPFRSQIMHNKIFFSILHNHEINGYLNADELNFVQKHIPQTTVLSAAAVAQARTQKDAFVLKPQDLYGGKNVICGLDCTEREWQKLLARNSKEPNSLLQEFCNFTQLSLPVFQSDKFSYQPFKTTLGLFTYNGKFSGLYSRVSQHNVIAGVVNSITLPSLVVKKK
ncbi:MAG: glutathionylspermidine synthase family protein [Candidatus Cloacimonadales bacterium]